MKRFSHINAENIDHVVGLLKKHGSSARVNGGGTDLLGCLKDELWLEQPSLIVNLKTIPDLSYIREKDGELCIGALTTLTTVAESSIIKEHYSVLAQAAAKTASPILRNIATLGGNICQENRCWYYRYPNKLGGRINCVRKGGKRCFAAPGDHRYHSIFGAVNKCIAVNPSDTAPALIALDAKIITTERNIQVEEFFSAEMGAQSTVLEAGELVIEIRIPRPNPGSVSVFKKVALRKSIDFAILNGAVMLERKEGVVTAVRICLNAVHNNPYRAVEAENSILGKPLTENHTMLAGNDAVKTAKPLLNNFYKVHLSKILISDLLMDCST